MSGNQPVLVSIKSNWESIAERPTVGKDVLELLSSSMYVNPLSIYREFVQNAADSIEEAIALGLLPRETGRVEISVDPDKRAVRIRDNGTGIERPAFTRTLVALGASRKRGTKARGFRGVGRLAGLGYCRELIFRSLADGEHEISEMRWDCQRLKSILRDVSFKGDVEELIKEVVRVQRRAAKDNDAHFFEVELSGIVRHGDDRLMNSEAIRDYLSQVAPVPFSPSFKLGRKIEERMRQEVNLGTVRIFLNEEVEPLFRPHRDTFEARKGVTDQFADVRFFEIKGNDGELAAKGWVIDHGYFGAIDGSASIKGLRLRSGNMQVGEADVLGELFTEARFNAWVVGEFHVLDDRILPNGRRDHFEQNVHFSNLLGQVLPIAQDLSRRCRQSSIRRNVIRQFETLSDQILHNLAVMRQGAIGQEDRKRLEKDTLRELKRIEKIGSHSVLEREQKERIGRTLSRYEKNLQEVNHRDQHRVLTAMNGREKKLITRVCSLIYECSLNKAAAKLLIDRVLSKLTP
ncbi:MAG: family molecular chaperone-like protein [Acidobacteriales bacterium]|nr:family molecular chaperone-like protein [Terriglobales bacterium]